MITLTKRPTLTTDYRKLNNVVEFDQVWEVLPGGVVVDGPADLYAPTVYDDECDTAGWELVDGYSGKYGYTGSVMHESETFSGYMARDTINTPGIYALVVCYSTNIGCPACGEFPDYCQGHGTIGDPEGAAVMVKHYNNDHSTCDPFAECVEPNVSGWALARFTEGN